jgi:transcriptional regulator with XRE-family HTH domain
MTLAQIIRRLREERGLTQIALAKQMRLTQSAICQAETGVVTPRVATLRRFANALRVSVKELLK